MATTQEKAELALIAYLKTKAPEVTWYAGHGTENPTALPRGIVTFAEGLELCPGVDDLPGEIHLLNHLKKRKPSDPDPVLAPVVNKVRGALCEEALPEVLSFINIPEAGADNREVKGFGMSGIDYKGFTEGRDSDHNLHGVVLRYQAVCHLEAE